MKKLENFSWKIWHLYALVSVTIFMIGGICSFFYLKEAGYVVNERNYTYVGKGQRLTDFKKVEGVDVGFPILAISFKEDGYTWRSYQYAVGHRYLAFQDSKLGKTKLNEKDPEEYFKIRYYLMGEEKGEGHTIDVLKIAQKMGYKTVKGEMQSTMYSDGKDDYVEVNLQGDKSLFINLRTQKASQNRPKEPIRYGYKGIYKGLSNPEFYTKNYWNDVSQTKVSWPWVQYVRTDEEQSITSNSEEEEEDSKLLSLLKNYGFLLILEEDRTLSNSQSLVQELFPDATNFGWLVDEDYTKDGKSAYIENSEELHQVLQQEKVEREHEDEE